MFGVAIDMLLEVPTSLIRVTEYKSQLHCQFQLLAIANPMGQQVVMAQEFVLLSIMWGKWMEFLAPALGLAQSQLLETTGE